MRYFISARHGDYSGDDRADERDELTPKGIMQIKNLAGAVKSIVGSDNICLASTNARRVIQTAGILQKELNISDYIQVSGRNERGEIAKDTAFKIFSSKEGLYQAMIFVTHELPASKNAGYIAMKRGFSDEIVFGLDFGCCLDTGHAVLLDLEQKTHRVIPEIKPAPKKRVRESQEDSPF
jgi:phosphohistidine phosphatase SixA